MVKTIRERVSAIKEIRLSAECELNESEKGTLNRLAAVSRIMDSIMFRQIWSGMPDAISRLASEGGESRETLKYLVFSRGPWDLLDGDCDFMGCGPRDPRAEFYPKDMTKDEFEETIAKHPELEAQFRGYRTVIRRSNGVLTAVPYHIEYHEFVEAASARLKEAASITQDKSLRRYLNSRASALLSDDYYESDLDWLELNGKIEAIIGAYEMYDDRLFSYKTTFSSTIAIVDEEATARAKIYMNNMDEMNRKLPISKDYKFRLGKQNPILRVTNLVFAGGQAKGALSIVACNLPNDKRFIEKHGSKKVLFRNSMKAKFDALFAPSALILFEEDQSGMAKFESLFDIILAHEISHGLGPMRVSTKERDKPINETMLDLYNEFEECKANVLGVHYLGFLMEKGTIAENRESLYVTYLLDILRMARVGIGEAHTAAATMEYNFLKETGVIKYNSSKTKFSADIRIFQKAIEEMTGRILDIQASGSYSIAKEFHERYCKEPDEMEAVRAAVKGLPLDINLTFYNL